MRVALLLAFGLVACSSSDETSTPSNTDTGVTVDTSTADSSAVDSSVVDSALDTGPEVAMDASTPPSAFCTKMSEMDLYSDIAKKTVHPRNHEFKPTYELWTDAAEKRRWIALPPGGKIDTSDMDHWVFPVGTRTWKEFARGGKLLETRMVEKTGDDAYRMGSYVWNDAGTEAIWTTAGENNVLGTTHDVPNEAACQRCHFGQPGRVIGFSAIQLAKSTGPLPLSAIGSWLTVPAASDYGVPGNAVQSAALGYLHANCAHCHNPNDTVTYLAAGMDLTIYVADKDPTKTKTWTGSVNQKTERYTSMAYRIYGGDTSKSAMYVRMTLRDKDQMPPLGTEVVHTAGLATLKAWIDTLPPP